MAATTRIHATAFAYHGAGCLLLGASGSGKSLLAAQAILQGATLIADDQVCLRLSEGRIEASAPAEIAGVMELRGFGLMRVNDLSPTHPIHLVVELDAAVDSRLPEPAFYDILGLAVPYVRVPAVPKTAAATLLLALKAMQEGRMLAPDWHPTRLP
ncbi:MAG: HPr kinase/phosphatase C-terminal domain-containing protein [Pseudomonadota bacterium]